MSDSLHSTCTEWPLSKRATGHGLVSRGGKLWSSHRWYYTLTYGPIPPNKVVRHKCDNAACVNPIHLELGSQAQNMRDMAQRGRARNQHTKPREGK